MSDWEYLPTEQLKPGMRVHNAPTFKQSAVVTKALPAVTGRCNHGIHFGNGCYDTLAHWWVITP